MPRILTAEEAVKMIGDGSVVHVSGFLNVGTPLDLIDALLAQKTKDLTIICNDGGVPNRGVGDLIKAGQVKKFICTWCGYTPAVSELVNKNELELELNPQGTFVERIRAAGYGLGGVLTPTGINTLIEEKGYGQRMSLNGKDWLYHTPLKADFTLTQAYRADKAGNLIYRGTQKNFGPSMCMAGQTVIASVVNPVEEIGALNPDQVTVPGVIVDILVQQRGDIQ